MQTSPLQVGPRSTDLSEPILQALADGPKTSPILAQRMACSPSRLLYYLEPLAFRFSLIKIEKVARGTRGGQVCLWSLTAPLDVALEALRQADKPAPPKEAEVLDVAPPQGIEPPKATPPKAPSKAPPKAPSKAFLASRLEFIRSRHLALIASGRIKRRK